MAVGLIAASANGIIVFAAQPADDVDARADLDRLRGIQSAQRPHEPQLQALIERLARPAPGR